MWNKAHRKEIVVYGDGNCFYRAVSLWNDRTTDQNHGRVRVLINRVLESFPHQFQPFLFQVSSIPLHLAKSKRSGTWAETVDIVACATLFQRNIFVYSMSGRKWNRFPPVVKLYSTCPLVVQSKSCQCPITLVLHDQNPATAHFNLLSPIVRCCTTALPSNVRVKPNSSARQPNASTKQPSTKQPNASTKQPQQPSTYKQPNASTKNLPNQDTVQSSSFKSTHDLSEKSAENFERMNIKQLKEYIQSRGITVSGYNKPDLIILANAIHSMKLEDPNFEKDSLSQCLNSRLTLPAGQVVADPFTMTKLSNDFSKLPPFGLIDIFNHLILLAPFRSFDEYTLFQDGYVRSMGTKTVRDNDGAMFSVVIGEVIPTQKELTQEGMKLYKLWFIFQPNGSIYSAFCRCKGGADQGCRHLGAALFELDDFLSSNRISATSLPAYWNPKPTPNNKPIPFKLMKISHLKPQKGKRKVTPCDESWIDSFDPRPKRHRNDTPLSDQKIFSQQLMEIDPDAAILKFLPCAAPEEQTNPGCKEGNLPDNQVKDTCPMSIFSKAQAFVTQKNISAKNVQEQAKVFCDQLSLTNEERDAINKCTIGQRENRTWMKMRHLMVTATKIKSIYTRQKTLEKKTETDVSTTVNNFLSKPLEFKKAPIPAQYGIEKESDAKLSYKKLLGKTHHGLSYEETGILVSEDRSWLRASLDGIRKCKCCEPRVVEIKCPLTGSDLDPKAAFLSDNVGGTYSDYGKIELRTSHSYYYQVQTQMAVSGLQSCDFVTFTNKGIYIVQIDFNKTFWDDIISKVSIFYENKIIPALLLQLSSQSLPLSYRESDASNESDDSNTLNPEIQTFVIENNNSEDQFQDIASEDSVMQSENQNYDQPSSIENYDGEDQFQDTAKEDSNMKSRSDNIKLDPSELTKFLNREKTRKTLENFIVSGCGDIHLFSSKNVTFEVIKILKTLGNDGDDVQGEIFDEILQELFVLYPSLNKGLHPLDVSNAISATHQLIKMYLEEHG